jgi:mono/diheme cytochrome c family protein
MTSRRGGWAIACVLALICAGCAKTADQSTTTAVASATHPAPVGPGDTAHGKAIYADNCSQCHGATGTEGGLGPSLRDERKRKTYAQTIGWIEDPVAPMPKLYPSPLSDKDVADVASFVLTL